MTEPEHPVLARARDAGQIADDLTAFWNPVEKHLGPHEDGDWPRDLTGGELDTLIPRLCGTIQTLAETIGTIAATPGADPGKARQVIGAARLIDQAAEAIRAAEPVFSVPAAPSASSAQTLARHSFPEQASTSAGSGAPGPAAGLPGHPPPRPVPGSAASRCRP